MDFEHPMRKLAKLDGSNPHGRVGVWREILEGVHKDGFDEGYMAARRDREVADMIAEQEARAALPEEKTGA